MKALLTSPKFQRFALVAALAAIAVLAHRYGGDTFAEVAAVAGIAFSGALRSFLSDSAPAPKDEPQKDEPPKDPPSTGGMGAAGAALLAFLFFGGACVPQLTPGDRADLADHASKLAKCQAEGHDAGSFSAYETCKHREGLDK